MRTIPRAAAAIFGGLILGTALATPAGFLIQLLSRHDVGDKWNTLSDVAYEVVIAFLTGFFAGLIFTRSGKLIGALAQVVPAALVFIVSAVVHRDANNLLIMTGIGLLPAIVGGSYGERFPRSIVSLSLNVLGFGLMIVFGLWGFAVCLGIVNKVAGFWGVVAGFTVAPVTLAAAPWYALVAWVPGHLS